MCTIVFRTVSTPLIIVFLIFNLIHIKYNLIERKNLKHLILISSPFLLTLLFLFHNDTISGGFKVVEKVLSLLIFPLFILNNKHLQLKSIFNNYRILFPAILVFFLLRFIIIFPEKIEKYIHGIDLIEIGYQYAISLGSHAPSLNLHVGFLTIVNFYFLLHAIINPVKNKVHIILNSILFLVSFGFVLIINTRITLACVFLCIGIIIIKELINIYSLKKTLISLLIGIGVSVAFVGLYVKLNPYMIEKYSSVTFLHMDKVGKLDEIENPEVVVFNALVTRVSIWKSSVEVIKENLPFGTGPEKGKKELFKYYEKSNQKFLAKYEFPVHNQLLDFGIKFGILGFIICGIYLLYPFFVSKDLNQYQSLFLCFGVLFFISNQTDDFLIRFDGIVFSGLFYSLFSSINNLKSKKG